MTEKLGSTASDTQPVLGLSILGPAHPLHPEHLEHYTADGISLTEPDAELHTLEWDGYGAEAALRKVLKSVKRAEGTL